MAFKDAGKNNSSPLSVGRSLTITETVVPFIFNAFTEDSFHWNNDLEGDEDRRLLLKSEIRDFSRLFELEMDNRIRRYCSVMQTSTFELIQKNGRYASHEL